MTETTTSSTAPADLKQLYRQHLQERGFRPDAAQESAVTALDDLRKRLLKADGGSAGPLKLLSKLGRRNTPRVEKGLYFWGGVGRGKTWLMDLFFQSLPFEAKRRRHFHRFMHDVYDQLKELGNRESPLEQVAENIARDTRVLCFDEFFVSDIADAMILATLLEALFRRGVAHVATSKAAPS